MDDFVIPARTKKELEEKMIWFLKIAEMLWQPLITKINSSINE